jgi:hypothetical protein
MPTFNIKRQRIAHNSIEVMRVSQNFNSKDMPQGLRMALTRNMDALSRFTDLSESGKVAFIQGARQVRSRQEMEQYVNNLAQNNSLQ